MIALIRKNKLLSWCFAFCMGLIFLLILEYVKNLLWNRSFDFISLSASTPKLQLFILTIFLNFITDLTSSLIAAIIPGYLLFYIFGKKAFYYSLLSIVIFLTLSIWLRRFWKAPDIGMQISALMGPVLSALILIGIIWLFAKMTKHKYGHPGEP